MNILVTGAKGFIGQNLVSKLKTSKNLNIMEYDINSSDEDLDRFLYKADFVIHLAGVNRSTNELDFMKGNFGLTSHILEKLDSLKNRCPIMLSSSIQAVLDNPYGKSKLAGEELLLSYSSKSKSKVYIYRFNNVFGKWCKPNYNSVIATFCYNISRGIPIKINNPNTRLNLIYIDDVVNNIFELINNYNELLSGYREISPVYEISLEELATVLYSFKDGRINKSIPDMNDSLIKKLYSTYLSYLPEQEFSYVLETHVDSRGSFTEFIRSHYHGQISINVSKPGVTKGNHWHHTKVEKFLVVSGSGVIRFRNINGNTIYSYYVTEKKFEVIDVPPGYTHQIENTGDKDLIILIWANENFEPSRPDTIFEDVIIE